MILTALSFLLLIHCFFFKKRKYQLDCKPKFNLHHLQKISAGKRSGRANSEIGYFVNTGKNLLKNRNWTSLVVHYLNARTRV